MKINSGYMCEYCGKILVDLEHIAGNDLKNGWLRLYKFSDWHNFCSKKCKDKWVHSFDTSV